jgi:phage shock protein E
MGSLLRTLAAISLAFGVLAMTSCGASEASGTVVRVHAQAAVELIGGGEHTVLDVRTPEEFEAGHVAGAVNIDASAEGFEDRLSALDSDGPYLVYARDRERSAPVAERMSRAGIEMVVDAGSFGALAIAGAELE